MSKVRYADDEEMEQLEAYWAELERKERAKFALENWLEIYRQIVNAGGILPPTEDYRDIPVCVRRRDGFPVDVMASQFGYSYTDEFVEWVASAHREWQTTDRRYNRAA